MVAKKIGKFPKISSMWSNLSTWGRMICENLKDHSFPEESIYERSLAIAQIFLIPNIKCVTRKRITFRKIKIWNYVSWKQDGNSNMYNNLLEKRVQQGYRPNLKGTWPLAIKLNSLEGLKTAIWKTKIRQIKRNRSHWIVLGSHHCSMWSRS